MKDATLTSTLYVARKSVQKVDRKSGHEQFFRLPASVLKDGTLTFAARCVYALLAGCTRQGTVARIGQREIARQLSAARSTVNSALGELASAGHLVTNGTGKQRRTYHLVSDVFGQKQRDGVTEVVSTPRGSKYFASIGKEKLA